MIIIRPKPNAKGNKRLSLSAVQTAQHVRLLRSEEKSQWEKVDELPDAFSHNGMGVGKKRHQQASISLH